MSIFLCALYGLFKHASKSAAIENVVTQYQTSTIVTDKLLANDECLCQTVRRGLLSIFKSDTQFRTIA